MAAVVEIPTAVDTDVEDVVWALQTADALWKRNERSDAIVWLRRAAQAAGEVNDDDRALVFARAAAELSEAMGSQALPPVAPAVLADGKGPSQPPPVRPPLPSSPGDRGASQPPPLPVRARTASVPPERGVSTKPPQRRDPSSVDVDMDEISLDAPKDRSSTPVRSAAEVHADMLDPWADSSDLRPSRRRISTQDLEASEEDVVTSAVPPGKRPTLPADRIPSSRPTAPTVPRADVVLAAVATAQARRSGAPPPPLPPVAAPVAGAKPDARTATGSGPAPPEPSPSATASGRAPPEPTPGPPVPARAAPSTRDDAPLVLDPIFDTIPPPAVESAAAREGSEKMPNSDDPHARRTFDLDAELSGVEGLADLPDDVREAFAGRSVLHDLDRNEIVSEFALALVLDGEVDVSSADADSPRAARVRRGEPLRSRGTTDEAVPLHLICATDSARVVTWDAAAVEAAFKACPWVEEDLRAAADRVQTLVAVSLGPLGRLDSRMREDVVSRLEARALIAGDVIVEQGKPVPGLVIVGIGDVELVRDGEVEEHLRSGAFLFTEQILHAGSAPATARAGQGGVLILFGNRMVAQELLVTCAPLLEIFAGM